MGSVRKTWASRLYAKAMRKSFWRVMLYRTRSCHSMMSLLCMPNAILRIWRHNFGHTKFLHIFSMEKSMEKGGHTHGERTSIERAVESSRTSSPFHITRKLFPFLLRAYWNEKISERMPEAELRQHCLCCLNEVARTLPQTKCTHERRTAKKCYMFNECKPQ